MLCGALHARMGTYYTWNGIWVNFDGTWANKCEFTQLLSHAPSQPQVVDVPSVNHPEVVMSESPVPKTAKQPFPEPFGGGPIEPLLTPTWGFNFVVPKEIAALMSYPGPVYVKVQLFVDILDYYAPKDTSGAIFRLDLSQWLSGAIVSAASFARQPGRLIATAIASGVHAFQGVAPKLSVGLDWKGYKAGDDSRHQVYVDVTAWYAASFLDVSWPGEWDRGSGSLSLDSFVDIPSFGDLEDDHNE